MSATDSAANHQISFSEAVARGYSFKQWQAILDANPECYDCRDDAVTKCESCGDPVCDTHQAKQADGQIWCANCDERRQQRELADEWSALLSRKPTDILHSAWTRLVATHDITEPGFNESIQLIKSALWDARNGWTEPQKGWAA